MRYEDVTGTDDIYAGADGKVKDADYVVDFLTGWSDWLKAIIDTIMNFIEKIKYALENNG